jgi:sugar-specific transcriptional regulator TrmB
MVGIILTAEEQQLIFDILGLNENQSLVYTSLLSVGSQMLTLGQISQLTGLNYMQVRECMEVLIGGEYIDWIPDKISRYYARTPFLNAFLLAYDPITLISIQESSSKKLTDIEKNLQKEMNSLQDLMSDDDRTVIQDLYSQIKYNISLQQELITKEISALIYTIREMKERLSIILRLSRKLSPPTTKETSGLTTELLYGETTFILLLRDMVSRAKASVTICMPEPEIQTIITSSKLDPHVRNRVLIVGNFARVPKNILKKVISAGVRLKQASVEYWACIKDNEELLISPSPQSTQKHEEVIGIFSTNPTMVKFFSHQIRPFINQGSEIKIE